MGTVTDRRIVVRLVDGQEVRRPDTLVAEEPLEIRVGGQPLAVTMRTPGDDVGLALGFLLTEGLISGAADVATAKHCSDAEFRASARSELASPGASARSELASPAVASRVDTVASGAGNVLEVTLAPGVPPPAVDPTRNFYTTSSCGVCGKASIDAVRTLSRYPVADDPVRVDAEVLAGLPERLRTDQRVFDRTGGLHAAGLFTADGDLVCVREDVGRHNAVDKVVGWAVREGRLPLAGHVLLVSGRASFELTQKASMAGLPVLAAVSAPSTLAVDLATEVGMTLVGFLRPGRMNLYTGGHRIIR